MIKTYAEGLNARPEVIKWLDTILASYIKKHVAPLIQEQEHIVDYLLSNEAPHNPARMGYLQAKDNAEKWIDKLNKKAELIEHSSIDTVDYLPFENNFKVVKLLTERAYKREGLLMRNCVASYYGKNNCEIYSLRDAANEPHCTIEIQKNGDSGAIEQIKGKGNGEIHPAYIDHVIKFLDKTGLPIDTYDMELLGYKKLPDELQNIIISDGIYQQKYIYKPALAKAVIDADKISPDDKSNAFNYLQKNNNIEACRAIIKSGYTPSGLDLRYCITTDKQQTDFALELLNSGVKPGADILDCLFYHGLKDNTQLMEALLRAGAVVTPYTLDRAINAEASPFVLDYIKKGVKAELFTVDALVKAKKWTILKELAKRGNDISGSAIYYLLMNNKKELAITFLDNLKQSKGTVIHLALQKAIILDEFKYLTAKDFNRYTISKKAYAKKLKKHLVDEKKILETVTTLLSYDKVKDIDELLEFTLGGHCLKIAALLIKNGAAVSSDMLMPLFNYNYFSYDYRNMGDKTIAFALINAKKGTVTKELISYAIEKSTAKRLKMLLSYATKKLIKENKTWWLKATKWLKADDMTKVLSQY